MKRQTRIITLLVIDTVFFFIEIIIGYMVHSLALIADSFHMLNDVMSLIVALYAIKLAAKQTTSPKYSYGWQRAEILGALINGVFLLALCLSIFLEAIQRFFEPQIITQPALILAVGSAGLASNIVGLVLFHDHGHSQGHPQGESDSEHGTHTHDLESGEHAHGHVHQTSSRPVSPGAMEDGSINDILPETIVRRASNAGSRPRPSFDRSPSKRVKRTSRQSFATAEDDIYVSPAANRQYVINQAHEIQSNIHEETDSGGEDGYNGNTSETVRAESGHKRSVSIPHDMHHHSRPRTASEDGHSHGNLNMKGVFLHVLGDALGNIGVIATALFIWGTDFSWRYYSDPVISLVITAIIFSSALPLVKSASLILLQGVPRGISLEEVKEDILQIDGVKNVHDLHIWQLSDVKMIASVHIQVDLPQLNRTKRYHSIARAIRTCLHAYGIHNSTIQPEFTDDIPNTINNTSLTTENEDTPLLIESPKNCLFECIGGEQCADSRCCETGSTRSSNGIGTSGSRD